MILYQYHCKHCGNTFDELREVEMRKWCYCPNCGETAYKTTGAATADTNFRPGWFHNIAPVPVHINSREEFTKVANMLGNYANRPFCKREAMKIVNPRKRAKARIIAKLKRGQYE